MRTELGERLDDLATQAPPGLSADGLWDRGRRRGRARRAAAVVAVVLATGSLIGGAQIASHLDRPVPPAQQPHGSGHLPRTVYEPAPWSEGTAGSGLLGPLAVIGDATRIRAVGWGGKRDNLAPFGISATDGTARFLDLPGTEGIALGATRQALSPDGKKVAFVRLAADDSDAGEHALGWGVYDTTTGKTLNLIDKSVPRPGENGFELTFTGGSRYLLTDYAPAASTGDREHKLVAWDVRTGTSRLLEPPGNYWIPEAVPDPSAISWTRDNKVFRIPVDADGKAGVMLSTVALEHDVVSASFGPDGRAFAYFGGKLTSDGIDYRTWRLYVGGDPGHLRLVPGLTSGTILGWGDATHVVVADEHNTYQVVDLTDGSVERGTFSGHVNLYQPAMIASDLWASPLVPGVRPPDAGDPRSIPKRIGLAILAAAVLSGLLVLRRRRRG